MEGAYRRNLAMKRLYSGVNTPTGVGSGTKAAAGCTSANDVDLAVGIYGSADDAGFNITVGAASYATQFVKTGNFTLTGYVIRGYDLGVGGTHRCTLYTHSTDRPGTPIDDTVADKAASTWGADPGGDVEMLLPAPKTGLLGAPTTYWIVCEAVTANSVRVWIDTGAGNSARSTDGNETNWENVYTDRVMRSKVMGCND